MKKKILKNISIIRKKFRGKELHVHEPSIFVDDIKSVLKSLNDKQVSTYGKYTKIFENKVSRVIKKKNVISTINGTSALHLALKVLNVKKGTEVLVPSLTFISTVNAIIYNNADPHFIEVNPNDLSVDIFKLDNYLKKISFKKKNKTFNKKTKKEIKYLLLVHLNGLCGDIYLLKKVLKKYHIKLIEDAAEAFGSYYKKKHLGTFGDAGIFSFNGNKILTTGGGGAIFFKNNKDFKKGLSYATHCKKIIRNEINYEDIGYNYRMPSLNASLGISQINKINFFKRKKKNIHKFYEKLFLKDNLFILLKPHKNLNSNYWLNTIIINQKKLISKKKLVMLFKKKNINVKSVWKPLHSIKKFKKYPSMNLKQTENIYKNSIILPSSSFLWR